MDVDNHGLLNLRLHVRSDLISKALFKVRFRDLLQRSVCRGKASLEEPLVLQSIGLLYICSIADGEEIIGSGHTSL